MEGKLTAYESTPTLPGPQIQLFTHDTLQYPQPLYIPNNNSQRAPYKTNNKKHDTMRYLYSQDAIYTNPSWKLLFPSAGKTDNKYKPEGLISQVSTRMKVTWSKTMLYWTGSASYKAT